MGYLVHGGASPGKSASRPYRAPNKKNLGLRRTIEKDHQSHQSLSEPLKACPASSKCHPPSLILPYRISLETTLDILPNHARSLNG